MLYFNSTNGLFIMVKMAKTGQMVRMASPGLTDKTGILLLSA